MWRSIRKHQSINAELTIVNLITKITAIGEVRYTGITDARQPLIDPVPNKPTL